MKEVSGYEQLPDAGGRRVDTQPQSAPPGPTSSPHSTQPQTEVLSARFSPTPQSPLKRPVPPPPAPAPASSSFYPSVPPTRTPQSVKEFPGTNPIREKAARVCDWPKVLRACSLSATSVPHLSRSHAALQTPPPGAALGTKRRPFSGPEGKTIAGAVRHEHELDCYASAART